MITSKVTRFRAYQLGTSGSSFSYYVDGHFTVLEARLTDISRRTLRTEMERCSVQRADVLHISSWDSDHCSAFELPELLRLVRPVMIELPGYQAYSENARECLKISMDYISEVRTDNWPKTFQLVTPEYINGLETAQSLCFKNTFYNPLVISADCANDNSTVKHFRGGSLNVLSLGDVESANISARFRRCKLLGRETDVMILAHHGGDNGFTTKSFLRHLEPSLAVCSADYANQYDHPRQEVRDLLYKEGIRLMTTKTGDIIVKSVGDHIGDCKAINLNADSTQISSEFEFTSKKKKLLSYNADTLRQIYSPTPAYRRIP
jgi:competence protein ComEC